MPNRPIRILFVCAGNICRSPMAEAIMRNMVQIRGLTHQIQVDSAGTGSWHQGRGPHPGTLAMLKSRNIPAIGLKARQIDPRDLTAHNWILVMDRENYRDVMALHPPHPDRVRLILSFHPNAPVGEVPDPYHTGQFEQVFKLLEPAITGFLDTLVEGG